MTGDQASTSTGREFLDDLVELFEASFLVGFSELVGKVIVTDRAEVNSGIIRQDVLRTSCGVLGGSSGNVNRRHGCYLCITVLRIPATSETDDLSRTVPLMDCNFFFSF